MSVVWAHAMNIVCFGDSLTVGYQSPTSDIPYYHTTPYGALLQEWFGERATVNIRGINGELTGEMVERFARDVLEDSPHFVIILGGTNDLGANISVTEIFKNLSTMYEQARKNSVYPIAVTVPSLRISGEGVAQEFLTTHIERRYALNQSLMDYCGTSGIPCIDFFSKTVEEDTSLLAAQYSNDGIHLSTAGYEMLAQMLWSQVWASQYEDNHGR